MAAPAAGEGTENKAKATKGSLRTRPRLSSDIVPGSFDRSKSVFHLPSRHQVILLPRLHLHSQGHQASGPAPHTAAITTRSRGFELTTETASQSSVSTLPTRNIVVSEKTSPKTRKGSPDDRRGLEVFKKKNLSVALGEPPPG